MPAANTLESYMALARDSFDPERAAGRSASLQYNFTGAVTGACYIIIHDGALVVAEGHCAAPTATVTSDFDLWLRIISYDLDPLIAYQEGLFTVDGDLETLLESDAWFRRRPRR